ncbi:MAG: YdjY domain-containing protein [Desulfocapsa sp.]|nr:YdjY domain-containing protein [Desulfocapsa sp.]
MTEKTKKTALEMKKDLIGKVVTCLAVLVLAGIFFHTGPTAHAGTNNEIQIVEGTQHRMIIDRANKELRITATVTKDCSKPGVCDFGRRFQAFFGMKGGKMEKYFVFTTDVPRSEINKAIQELGVVSRNQIPMEEVETRRGLSKYTKNDDYLKGDPVIVTAKFKKDGQNVEVALEDLVDERINVEGSEIFKPYTPHFVYHGTGEAINFPSGCIVCPSDCNGGIITDNSIPLKHTVNYYKVNWDKMPLPGTEAEIVLKSIF